MVDILEMRLNENTGEETLKGISQTFPYTKSRAFLNRYTVCWHWHKAVELFFVERSLLEYETSRGRMVFPAGSGGLVNTGVLHTTRLQENSCDTIQLLHIFHASLLYGQTDGRIYQKYFSPILTVPQIEIIPLYPNNPGHIGVLEKLKNSFAISEHEFGYELRLRDALTNIWSDLLKLLPPITESTVESSEKIKRMMIFIHEHYQERIAVSDVATAGCVSQREYYRSFQKFLHTSPVEYMKDFRLQVACRMLSDGNDSITQISHVCGFGSSSFFGKVFSANLGLTPTAYRKKWQDTTK